MSKEQLSAEFQSVQRLYLMLLLGQLFLCLVIVFMGLGADGGGETSGSEAPDNRIFLMSPILLIAACLWAYWMRLKQEKDAATFIDREKQLDHYRDGILVRLAVLEVANIITILMMILTSGYQLYFLTFFVVGIGTFLLLRPSEREFQEWYP
ncbi:MAG: hypothetical protein AAFV25_09930 [Bacteroidota bacterium]